MTEQLAVLALQSLLIMTLAAMITFYSSIVLARISYEVAALVRKSVALAMTRAQTVFRQSAQEKPVGSAITFVKHARQL